MAYYYILYNKLLIKKIRLVALLSKSTSTMTFSWILLEQLDKDYGGILEITTPEKSSIIIILKIIKQIKSDFSLIIVFYYLAQENINIQLLVMLS